MSAHPESNGHHPELARVREVLAFEDDLEIEVVEGSVGDIEFPVIAELVDQHAQVFRSYPYARFEMALNGQMTPREWVRDLARHVDTYLLPD
jgi:hypothetical protein